MVVRPRTSSPRLLWLNEPVLIGEILFDARDRRGPVGRLLCDARLESLTEGLNLVDRAVHMLGQRSPQLFFL